MIFKQWKDVLAGRKTQTRRVVKPGEVLRGDAVYGATGRLKWEVGREYAVQPKRGEAAVGRMRLTAIRREPVQAMTLEDALAEGIFESWPGGPSWYDGADRAYRGAINAYRALWDAINDRPGLRWEDNPQVWVLTFERVGL
jgi:hypothetical protein